MAIEKHLFNSDCIEGMKILPNESVDVILTDPPYKYLKNQKLEVDFDETAYFNQVNRVLKKGGFIVLFGRGTSFYRWNTMLNDLGFEFKEEVVWNKRMNTLPGLSLQRFHETISIHSKGKSKINKVRVPYIEKKQFDISALTNDIKRICSALNSKELDDLKRYIEEGNLIYTEKKYNNFFKNGHGERSRAAAITKSICEGMCEGSIIEVLRGHYDNIHPTQKPVRLLERLLNLVRPTRYGKVVVIDTFAGSFSTCEAVQNVALENPENHYVFYGWEIDKQYYDDGLKRLTEINDLFS